MLQIQQMVIENIQFYQLFGEKSAISLKDCGKNVNFVKEFTEKNANFGKKL